MVKFVQNQSKPEQFIVGGGLYLLSDRVSNTSNPSASMLEGDMVIVGPNDRPQSLGDAYERIIGPFRFSTWLFLVVIAMQFAIVRVLIACCSTRPFRFSNFLERIIHGSHLESDTFNKEESNMEFHSRNLNRILQSEIKVFVLVVVVFYELAAVSYIFINRPIPDIANLSVNELSNFSVVEDSAETCSFEGKLRRIDATSQLLGLNQKPKMAYLSFLKALLLIRDMAY